MYNPSFESLKTELRKNLEVAGFHYSSIDTFVSRLSMLVPSETYQFNSTFTNVKKVLDHVKEREPGTNTKTAITLLFAKPEMYFEINEISFVKETKAPSPEAASKLSPYLVMLAKRSRPFRGGVLSESSREVFAVPAVDRIPPGTPRIREYGEPEGDGAESAVNNVRKKATPESSHTNTFRGAAKPKQGVALEDGSIVMGRGKILPPYHVIAAAAWKWKDKYHESPQGAAGKEFLPANSMSWGTMTIHHLKGENSLPSLMKKYPRGYSHEAALTAAAQASASPAIAPALEA